MVASREMSRAIHHIALRSAELERTAHFYEQVVGLTRGKSTSDARGTRSVWLHAGDARVMCERREREEPGPPPGSQELVAFALAPEEWSRIREHLSAHGIAVEAETRYTLYFRDPDGRRVGLSRYPSEGVPSAEQ